jgi:Zn-dependent protease
VGCGTELAAGLLVCPVCHRLVHAAVLPGLVAQADAAEQRGEPLQALTSLRSALELLPPGSRQHEALASRIASLSRQMETSGGTPDKRPAWAERTGALGVLALLLWKAKGLLALALGQGKLLLGGLGQSGTLLTMLLSLGVYWTAWGWPFALGLVLSMYVHEMGHVAALRRHGIAATAPMFVPGLGALVRLKQYPVSAREDARVGLAGPLWGLGAALVALLAYLATGAPVLTGIVVWGARLNLFNLMPLGPLDGGRGLRSLSRGQRLLLVLVMGAAYALSGEGLLALVLLISVLRLVGEAPAEHDWGVFAQFAILVVALAALTTLPVPLP